MSLERNQRRLSAVVRVLTTGRIYHAFYADELARGFLHSHSYTGNALACTAALATLAIFEEAKVIEANQIKAESLSRMAEPLARHPAIRHFRRIGMIWAFEFDTALPDFARQFHLAALKKELLRPIGNTVYLMPPFIIDEQESELLMSRTLELVDLFQ